MARINDHVVVQALYDDQVVIVDDATGVERAFVMTHHTTLALLEPEASAGLLSPISLTPREHATLAYWLGYFHAHRGVA